MRQQLASYRMLAKNIACAFYMCARCFGGFLLGSRLLAKPTLCLAVARGSEGRLLLDHVVDWWGLPASLFSTI